MSDITVHVNFESIRTPRYLTHFFLSRNKNVCAVIIDFDVYVVINKLLIGPKITTLDFVNNKR